MKKVLTIWRIVIQFAWAKDGMWTVTTDKEQRTQIVSLNIVKREHKALEIIVGPVAIIIGFV